MNITIPSDAFVAAFTWAAKVAGQDTDLYPQAANIEIETEDDSVRITGTNCILWFSQTVPCEVNEAGRVSIPAKALLKFVKKLKRTKPLNLKTKGDDLIINAGFRATLRGVSSELPEPHYSEEDILSLTVSRKWLDSVYYHVKHILPKRREHRDRGAIVRNAHILDGDIYVTDGRRIKRLEVEGDYNFEINPVVFEELTHFDSDTIDINITSHGISYVGENKVITVARDLTDEKMLRMLQKNMSIDPGITLEVNRIALRDAASAAEALLSDKDVNPGLYLKSSNGTLTVSSQSPYGEMWEEIAVKHTFTDFRVKVNSRYLREALDAVDGETVELDYTDKVLSINNDEKIARMYER